MTIKIGTRGSRLALWQADFVRNLILDKFPALKVEIIQIKTTGDKILEKALFQINDKGLFTKELENELLSGNIDIAIHSLKDLPTELPDGLKIGAVTKREIPNDVLIAKNKSHTIDNLPSGAKIATSSLRRRAQLLIKRNDFQLEDMRGNVNTRIEKLFNTELNGLILAYAGVLRLGMTEYISQIIPIEDIIPAVGQAAIAIETREENPFQEILKALNNNDTEFCVSAEREFLKLMGGGCSKPITAHCFIKDYEVEIVGIVSTIDGTKFIKDRISKPKSEAENIGKDLAQKFDKLGANEILKLI
ncbi:MAG: hydroxymethylbilane synthase [Candidatus Kapabacteria bacterium]|nr:hydroxymethylbilane synthase [Candidatus Kapabacteria bacterium]